MDIDGYRIEAEVGRGGMGVVYRAEQLKLGRRVALKLIHPRFADNPLFRERFEREARLAAIEHRHVIPVYDAREFKGQLYISMRYIEGSELGQIIAAQGPLEPARAAELIRQVADALDAAHERGLVHRDVKPANILIEQRDERDHAYLTDFGLTKHAASHGGVTRDGEWVGTPDYVAPEQASGDAIDARTDVYALGASLYQALTGTVPYDRDGVAAKLLAHVHEPPPCPTVIVPELPAGFDTVVARAMAKNPSDRYPSAGDLGRAAVAAALDREPVEPERTVAQGEAAPLQAVAPAKRSDASSMSSRRPLQRLHHDGEVRGVAFGPDAKLLVTAGDDRTARLWDLATEGYELRRFTHTNRGRTARELLAVAFSPRGTTIATAGRDRTARVWDVADGRQLLRVSHRNSVRAVAFSPDGEQLATAAAEGTARVWSVPGRREVLSIDGRTPLNAVAFSPDGTCLATAGHDGSARVWDLTADRRLLKADHDGVVWAVAFSPDGRSIATASDDGTARIWDLSGDDEIRSIRHPGAVWAVAFDSTGSRLATAGEDASARVWDLTDGRELGRVSHDDIVWAVAFSRIDTLATASADHTARVWAV